MTGTRQPVPPRPRRGPGWWLRRVVPALLIGLLVAVGIDYWRGGITAIWLRYGGLLAYDARGERFQVSDGHELYLDCRGQGSPTLILEAGMGSDSATWSPIHDELAELTRTCSYDRTGRGRSDGGSAGDLIGMSVELSALLEVAGESPPYVVVGHSLGTVIGRVHASLTPDTTVGLVLVDGFDPDIFDAQVVPLLGPIQDEFVGHTANLWAMIGRVESIDVERSRRQLDAAVVEGVPIEVVLAPRYDARLDEATNARIETSQLAGYEALSPGAVTVTMAWGSGHMVQFDRPDVVIEAVRRMVERVRGT